MRKHILASLLVLFALQLSAQKQIQQQKQQQQEQSAPRISTIA
jgi:hypothetical protein